MLSYMLPTEDKPPPGEPSSQQNNYRATGKLQKSTAVVTTSPRKCTDATRAMIVSTRIEDPAGGDPVARHGSPRPTLESPKHNGTTTARKSTLHNANRVTKDDSLYSIDSVASTAGSERKNKILNGAKHASLKR
ncbi:uncharacterized protein [Temnothorax nylanderi]|uniref:uncharacterized protein n=1 Tax=Temnothorax nylanderi TaxID=102681 RepID=UPI003A87B419